MAFTWGSALRITIFLVLAAAVVTAFFTLPIEKVTFSLAGLVLFSPFDQFILLRFFGWFGGIFSFSILILKWVFTLCVEF